MIVPQYEWVLMQALRALTPDLLELDSRTKIFNIHEHINLGEGKVKMLEQFYLKYKTIFLWIGII